MAALQPYATTGQRVWWYTFRFIVAAILFFLIFPILVIMPLSFNALPYFTFTPGMLRFEADAYSLEHYHDFFTNPDWQNALWNSLSIAPAATLLSTALGTPFVIITVTATLVGFDRSLTRAAASLGANPVTTFFRIQMPLILPGVISGGLFAFITSFDEVVVVIFVGSAAQQTLPWQMFTGLREQISPTILAVATILVVISIGLLTVVELLRRRSERLRGMSPG
jgi:ABC-type spermidine/putrescine transport system permease subunit II